MLNHSTLNRFQISLLSLVAILLTVLSSTSTLSYFTDTDTTSTTFAIGNADTTLKIYDDISGDTYRELTPDSYPPLTEGTTIPLYLEAENIGNIPVYQRFRIVVPIALADTLTFVFPDCTLDPTTRSCETPDYKITYSPSVSVNDAPTYAVYYLTSLAPLSVASTTPSWPTSSLTIGALDEIDPSLLSCESSDSNSCFLGLTFHSDAIQTTGFSDSTAAFLNFTETY